MIYGSHEFYLEHKIDSTSVKKNSLDQKSHYPFCTFGGMAKRVALIDDDEIFNFLHREMILRHFPDAVIDQFNSGSEWIEYLLTHQETSFSAIYLDIRMPGMDGFQVLEKMQSLPNKTFSDAAIYVLSSTLDENDLKRSRANPLVKDFASKPLSSEQIVSLMG